MLGGYISDLAAGDVFEPVEYVLTAFMASEYAHGVEENWEGFYSSRAPGGRQMRPPTMIHVDKMRILEKNCLKEQRVGGAKGPHAHPAADGLTAFDWRVHAPDHSGHLVVPEDRCHRILAAAGLPVATARLVQDESAAVAAAEALGFPVVLKGISPSVTHRAAASLLAVDLRSGAEVGAASRRLQARAREIGAALDGLYVQKMHRGGTELLLAAFRDPMFGVMVSCGSGGVLTELIDDVVTERAPVDRRLAASMVDRLRIRRYAVDEGGPLGAEPVAAFLARFSELALTAPWRRFVFEVNPVKWTRDAVVAVDGLLIIDPD